MLLRLPHVLLLCALMLVAGLVSVELWQGRTSGALEPALVLVDDRMLTEAEARALAEAFDGRLETVPTDGRVLDPFDAGVLGARGRRGELTMLFSLDPATPRAGWQVVLDRTRDPVPLLRDDSLPRYVLEEAGRAARTQRALSAFVIGLTLGRARALDEGRRRDLVRMLTPLVEDLRGLPEFRRTSVVVLGPPSPRGAGWVRTAVRFDIGPWPDTDRPGVADLLGPSS